MIPIALAARDAERARRLITEHVGSSIDAFVAARSQLAEPVGLQRLA